MLHRLSLATLLAVVACSTPDKPPVEHPEAPILPPWKPGPEPAAAPAAEAPEVLPAEPPAGAPEAAAAPTEPAPAPAPITMGRAGEPPPAHCPPFEPKGFARPLRIKPGLKAELCSLRFGWIGILREGTKPPRDWQNKTKHVLTYDREGRLTKAQRARVGTNELRTIGYDEAGRIAWMETTDLVYPEQGTVRSEYTYDPRGYLLAIATRTKRGDRTIAITYDSACRVVRAGEATYAYTPDGSLAGWKLDEQGRPIEQGHDTFRYDDEGRIAYHKFNGHPENELAYDADDGLTSWKVGGESWLNKGYCPLPLCRTPPRIGDPGFYPCLEAGVGSDPHAYEWPTGVWSM